MDVFRGKNIRKAALNDVTFDVREGEIFGLLGPNGAGKTTLIKILSTLISPTSGTARIYGHDIRREEKEIKKLIGLIHSDERSFFWRLTGRQNLEFFAALLHIPRKTASGRIDELFERVGLSDSADVMFHYYSTGMKQKLAIARGLLNQPKILFMDEALRSIDPISSHAIRRFIKHETLEILGGTIILATHRLDEASELCDRVAILNKGSLIASGSREELAVFYQRPVQYDLELRGLSDRLIEHIQRLECVKECIKNKKMNGNMRITVTMDNEEDDIHTILHEIIIHNVRIQKCTRIEPTLENVFFEVVESSAASRTTNTNP